MHPSATYIILFCSLFSGYFCCHYYYRIFFVIVVQANHSELHGDQTLSFLLGQHYCWSSYGFYNHFKININLL